jgi:uncharacterized caspase-like protein
MGSISRSILIGFIAAGLGAPSPARAEVAAGPTARAPKRQMTVRRALVVGIGSYERAPALPFAVEDARAFAEFLKRQWGYPEEAVVLMTDDAATSELRPTQAGLQAQIGKLVESVTKDTEVVVYFAGYGARQSLQEWLLPLDGDPRNMKETAVSTDRLISDLVARKPKRSLLFLDADRNLQKEAKTTVALRAARGTELGVLYSCEAGERSLRVKEGQRGGVFTHYLLQGLAGDREAAAPGGEITFDGLKRYLQDKVRQYVVKEYSGSQTPYGIATSAEMVLGRTGAK